MIIGVRYTLLLLLVFLNFLLHLLLPYTGFTLAPIAEGVKSLSSVQSGRKIRFRSPSTKENGGPP